jgi:hypothetical protein
MRISVMEFNVEYGGELVDFQGVLNAIEASGASVVAIEEALANMHKIARGLGWPHCDPRTQIVSRYPILGPESTNGLYAYVEVERGRVVAVANAHLPSKRYGPFQIARKNASEDDVIAIEERLRVPALEPQLAAVARLASNGVPVFLTGDFNVPSHLDYTPQTIGLREHVKFPVGWPVSVLVERAGLLDSYRAAHPDPVTHPGITWPAFRAHVEGYNPGPDGEEADRIDFIYCGGPATPISSVIVGEEGADGVDIASSPWPTDHRATLSAFEVSPAPVPTLLSASSRLVDEGDPVAIAYRISAGNADATPFTIRVGAGDRDLDSVPASADGGEVRVETTAWSAGRYDVTLHGAGEGNASLGRTCFWVRRRGGAPEVATTQPTYRVGEPIAVSWNLAPGNRWDWLAIYARDRDPREGAYAMWKHTQTRVEGSATFDERTEGFPLEPGAYRVYLFEDDSFDELAAADFTIRP